MSVHNIIIHLVENVDRQSVPIINDRDVSITSNFFINSFDIFFSSCGKITVIFNVTYPILRIIR